MARWPTLRRSMLGSSSTCAWRPGGHRRPPHPPTPPRGGALRTIRVMHRRLPLRLAAAALLATACGGVDDLTALRDQAGEVRGTISEVRDRAGFCFAVTRSLTAADGGTSPTQAYEAAEEVLAQAPDELRDDARTVTDALEQAAEQGDDSVLRSDEFRDAASRLRDRTRELCDPR